MLKQATTIFECLAVHPGNNNNNNNNRQEENNKNDDEVVVVDCDLPCSLITARLLTGRQHQIRRHAFHMGMPILGDTQHGSLAVIIVGGDVIDNCIVWPCIV